LIVTDKDELISQLPISPIRISLYLRIDYITTTTTTIAITIIFIISVIIIYNY